MARLRVVCQSCKSHRFDPTTELEYTKHKMELNRRSYRFFLPFIVLPMGLFQVVASWSGCALFYRCCDATTLIHFFGSWLTSLRDPTLHDVAWTFGISKFVFHSTLSYSRFGRLTGMDCSAYAADDDEAYSLLLCTLGITVLCWSIRLSPRANMVIFVTMVLQWVVQLLALGSHQDFYYVVKLTLIWFGIVSFLFLGSITFDNAQRTEFKLHRRFKEQERELWSILQKASVPVAVFSGTSREDTSKDISVVFWNDALLDMCSTVVQEGTKVDDVVPLGTEAMDPLKEAIRAAIDPAKQQKVRQLLVPIIGPKGATWLSLDVAPVVRDGSSQFQAMVIGSDVSAFVSQHKSLLFSRKREVHFKERSGEIGAEEDREDCHSEASSRFSDDSDAQTRSSGNTGRLFNRINENLMKA